jgi:hypothetical protein
MMGTKKNVSGVDRQQFAVTDKMFVVRKIRGAKETGAQGAEDREREEAWNAI